jgi:hypothetical protein
MSDERPSDERPSDEKPHWTAFACEVIALIAISILVALGKVPGEVLVALVTATISGHSLGGRRPPGPPGAGLVVGTLAATGVGRSLVAIATRLGGAFHPPTAGAAVTLLAG